MIDAAGVRHQRSALQGLSAGASIYAADAWLFPPGADIVKGHDAIVKFFQSMTAPGVASTIAQTIIEVRQNGNAAYEIGTFTLTAEPKDNTATTTFRGKYIVVWRRQADGNWKMQRDIWNEASH